MSNSKHARGIEVGDDAPIERRKTVAAHPTPSRADSYTEVLLKFDSEVGRAKISKDTSEKAYELFFQLIQFVCDDVNGSTPFAPEIVHIVCGYANPFQYAFQLRVNFLYEIRDPSLATELAADEFYEYAVAHPDLPQLDQEVAALTQIPEEFADVHLWSAVGRRAAAQQKRLSPEFYWVAMGDGSNFRLFSSRIIHTAIANRNLPLLAWYESQNPDHAQQICLRSVEGSTLGMNDVDVFPVKEWLMLMRRSSFVGRYSDGNLSDLLYLVIHRRPKETMVILTSENGAYLPLVRTIADPDGSAFPPKLVAACQNYLKLVDDSGTSIDDAAVQRIINTLTVYLTVCSA